MELRKKSVHMNRLKEKTVAQITLDDDFIVPDTNPDIDQIVLDDGMVEIEEQRKLAGKVRLRGKLAFKLLYHAEGGGLVFLMKGSLPFDETVNMEQLEERDYLLVQPEIEDLSVEMINSRKISVKSVVTFVISAESIEDEQIPVEASEEESTESIMEEMEIAQIAVRQKDNFRVKKEFELSASQPNIEAILWEECCLQSVEIRTADGKISLQGEIAVFCLYSGEDERIPLQWVEKNIPFSGDVELPDAVQEMLPFIDVSMSHADLSIQPDFDGENRMVVLDAVLDLDIRLYEEEKMDVISDLYSPSKDIIPQIKEGEFERILAHNSSKFKINGKLHPKSEERVLQICHCKGNIKLDDVAVVENGLHLEGALVVQVLFLTASDRHPLQSEKGAIPFQYTLEAKDIDENCLYQINNGIEQLSAIMLGNDEIEIKGTILSDLFVRQKFTMPIIDDVTIQPFDLEKIQQMPGIVGYIVQKGDTLWKIAKKFHATVDSLKSVNALSGNEVREGERLLIIKQVEEML